MELNDYISYIKLVLTGRVLELELDDTVLTDIVNNSIYAIQPYLNVTTIETIPYNKCIDLSPYNVYMMTNVYRTTPIGNTGADGNDDAISDPIYLAQYQFGLGASMGGVNRFNKAITAYSSYLTALQTRNTISQDLNWKIDKFNNKLYVNIRYAVPKEITIEYVPIINSTNINKLTEHYWTEILKRMCIANTKLIIGRLRSKYKVGSSDFELDGETLLQEGKEELERLYEELKDNNIGISDD